MVMTIYQMTNMQTPIAKIISMHHGESAHLLYSPSLQVAIVLSDVG